MCSARRRLGRPLSEAMGAMCERVGSSDLDYVATAIDVQAQAGGSLASLFDTLSETVPSGNGMRGKSAH